MFLFQSTHSPSSLCLFTGTERAQASSQITINTTHHHRYSLFSAIGCLHAHKQIQTPKLLYLPSSSFLFPSSFFLPSILLLLPFLSPSVVYCASPISLLYLPCYCSILNNDNNHNSCCTFTHPAPKFTPFRPSFSFFNHPPSPS